MKIFFKTFLLLILILLYSSSFSYSEEFELVKGLVNTDVYSISTMYDESSSIFVGTDDTLYKSKKDLNDWEAVFTVKGNRSKVNHIFFDTESSKLYVATSSGLFAVTYKDWSYQEIFNGITSKQEIVHFVTTKGNLIYIGTADGLFYSEKDEIQWEKCKGLPEDTEVFWISFLSGAGNKAYIATSLGVYETDKNFKNLNRVFLTQRIDLTKSSENILVQESDYYAFLPRFILIDKNNKKKIYLGTTDGLFISYDGGSTWEGGFLASLGRISISSIIQEENNIIYVASDKGFFRIDLSNAEVKEIYKGLTTNEIRYAVIQNSSFLLATDKGLFKTDSGKEESTISYRYQKYFEFEPSIREVQQAAIEYNDISSYKIRNWRDMAKKKAWLPKFSVGADRNVTDLHYWDTNTSSGDDAILRKGDDAVEWDVSLSWDLGDLIWSGDQTSIDVRSRLNTQLRIDVLEDLNRVYFQRYRLKLRLLNSPPKEEKVKLEENLRLKELTAKLDSYTGGYFSRRCRELMKAGRE